LDWSRASFRDASFENRWRVAKRNTKCQHIISPAWQHSHHPTPRCHSLSTPSPELRLYHLLILAFFEPSLPAFTALRSFVRSPCYYRTTKQATMTAQEEATALKNKGNDAFKAQDWATAVEFYAKAIDLYDEEPSFYTNRAQVRFLTLHPVRTRPQLTIRLRPTSRWKCTD
jgi:hypothetical protein